MKLLSIDVGIKNLAFCLFEIIDKTSSIVKWEVVNIAEKENFNCITVEGENKCDKPAKYKKNFNYYCLKHAKKQPFKIPNFDFKCNKLSSYKISQLYEIADKYQIKYKSPTKKETLIQTIKEHISSNYLETIESQNGNNIDMITIATNLKQKFDTLLVNEQHIDYVIIENQISPIANRMKSIQGMLVQYFIMSNIEVDHIEFVSAINKLREFAIPEKTSYNDRKKISTTKCLEIIKESNANFLQYFSNHAKKDDLADSFLQGRWYLNQKII